MFGGWKEDALGSKEEADTVIEEVVGVTVRMVAEASEEARGSKEVEIAGKEVVGGIVGAEAVVVVGDEDIGHLTEEAIDGGIVVEEEFIEEADVRKSVGTEKAAVEGVGQLED